MISVGQRPKRRRRSDAPGADRHKSYTYRTHPAKRLRPPPGTCTWCLEPTLNRSGRLDATRRFCSRSCVDAYTLRTDAKLMRRFIFDRDLGCCATCGTRHAWGGNFEIDHERPLFLAFDDWDFWEPENLRIACIPCHLEKSLQERTLMKPARLARAKAMRKQNRQ